MKRVVIKIGTQLITDEQGLLNHAFIDSIVKQVIELKKQKIEVIIVSSGAVGAGRGLIKLPAAMNKIVQRQVLASVGQVTLMEAYSRALQAQGYFCSQVLTCKEDFRDRHHYLNMKNCFQALLHENIVPIVNENDVISIDELMFTDNDELAGLIGAMMDVDLVLILSTVEGIFDRHPKDPAAKLLPEIHPNDDSYAQYISEEKSPLGRGGMHTKARIAVKLAALGITAHIANGHKENVITRIVRGETPGTKIVPKKRLSGVKKWIAHSKGQEKGMIKINPQAETLLTQGKEARSLLPVGIIDIQGAFEKGDVVTIQNEAGKSIGIGIAQYHSDMAKKHMGQKNKPPLIHYDFLFFGEI
jgi:glutamate 5-kinase